MPQQFQSHAPHKSHVLHRSRDQSPATQTRTSSYSKSSRSKRWNVFKSYLFPSSQIHRKSPLDVSRTSSPSSTTTKADRHQMHPSQAKASSTPTMLTSSSTSYPTTTEPTEPVSHTPSYPPSRPPSRPHSSASLSTPASSHPLETPLANTPLAAFDTVFQLLTAAKEKREGCLARKEVAKNQVDDGVLALEANEQQHYVYEQQLYAYKRAFFIAKESLEQIDQQILSLSDDLHNGCFDKYLPTKHPPSLTHSYEHTHSSEQAHSSSHSSLLSESSSDQSLRPAPMW